MKDLTAKEKAKELVEKYSTYVVMWAGGIETSKQNVKQCALIAVDLLLEELFFESEPIYWQDVKSEIEKL